MYVLQEKAVMESFYPTVLIGCLKPLNFYALSIEALWKPCMMWVFWYLIFEYHFQVDLKINPEEEQYLLSECWGSFFYHEEEDPKHDKHMNTYWGRVINQYNVIAVPTIEYIAGKLQLL